MGMLYKATPDEMKLVLVDPKRLELGLYADIPHLFTPVVTDAKVAANVLRNATREMERRLKLLAQRGVRNIEQYNRTFEKGQSLSLFDGTDGGRAPAAALSCDRDRRVGRPDDGGYQRRRGIHHASCADGARRGNSFDPGDAAAFGRRDHRPDQSELPRAHFLPRGEQSRFADDSRCQRLGISSRQGRHAVSARGIVEASPGSWALCWTRRKCEAVCDFWREQAKAIYNEELLKPPKDENAMGLDGEGGEGGGEEVDDDLYQDAVRVVCEMGRASTSTLQRRLRVGYGRAARLIDLMEKDGIVGPPDGSKPREVLKTKDGCGNSTNP